MSMASDRTDRVRAKIQREYLAKIAGKVDTAIGELAEFRGELDTRIRELSDDRRLLTELIAMLDREPTRPFNRTLL